MAFTDHKKAFLWQVQYTAINPALPFLLSHYPSGIFFLEKKIKVMKRRERTNFREIND